MDFNVLQEMSLQGYFLCAVVLIGFICVFWRLGSILNELKTLNNERYTERTGHYRQRDRQSDHPRDRSRNRPREASSPVDNWLKKPSTVTPEQPPTPDD